MKEQVNHSHDRLIHHFPPEIAAYIFELAIPSPEELMDIDFKRPPRYAISAPFILSAVCRRWRAIAQSTPQLWKSIPLYLHNLYRGTMPATLFDTWIDRAGELPLSINLNLPEYVPKSATQIMDALNQRSNRLISLKYEGTPSFLPYFSQDYPQLQTLHLTNCDRQLEPIKEIFKPCPKRLNALSISENMLVAVDLDWQHLTQLVLLDYHSLSTCFEALRRAPCLTRCTFRAHRETQAPEHNSSPSENRILQHNLQYLEITDVSSACEEVLNQLLCPNLSTLVLGGSSSRRKSFDIHTIIELLRRSECSLERLSLLFTSTTASDVASLCEGIPTLQHLHVHAPYSRPSRSSSNPRSPSRALFTRLAKHSTINGTKELQYLPALRSLTWYRSEEDPWPWTTLLDIFGAPTARSANRRRQTLESVTISVLARRSDDPLLDIDEEALKRILWLRDSVGVKWDIRSKISVMGVKKTEEDLIRRAIDRHLSVSRS
jgi:hypothetical protein